MKKILTSFIVLTMIFASSFEVKAQETTNYGFQDIGYEAPVSTAKSSTARTNAVTGASYYNSVDYGYITPVRNQGAYGTCWSFSTINAIESSIIKQGVTSNGYTQNRSLDLSESQVVHSYWNSDIHNSALGLNTYDKMYNISGKDIYTVGGNTTLEAFSMSRWYGPTKEAYMPYGSITSATTSQLTSSANFALMKNAYFFNASSIDAIKEAIVNSGAVTASYHSSTTYLSSSYAHYSPNGESTNHAVSIVGWDDNYAITNFNSSYRPSTKGAWIVKNSWGTSWGNSGYFYISYYDTTLNNIVAYDMMSSDTYDYNYAYDGTSSLDSKWAWETIEGYQVFKGQNSSGSNIECLEAVQVGVASADTKVKVQVYTNLTNSSDPTSGTLYTSKSQTFTQAGIYTIDLDACVPMVKGKEVVVKVTLTSTTGSTVGMYVAEDVEYNWMRADEYTQSNQSYISTDGGTITDLHSSNACCRIKALTKVKARTDISTLTSVSVSNAYYTGSVVTPTVTIKDANNGYHTLTKGIDYTLSSNSSAVGTGTVTITGIGMYTGSMNKTFTILQKSITSATVTVATAYYTGSNVKPTVTVKDGSTKLTKGTHYTVTYSSAKKVGASVKITIKGTGTYKGTITKTVKIVKKPVSKLTIKGVPSTKTYTGKAIKPSITVYNGSTKLTKGTHYTVTYGTNKSTGKATIKITGKGNYSGTVTKTFYIVPKQTSITSVKNDGTKRFTTYYKKVTGASGYRVYYKIKGASSWSYCDVASKWSGLTLTSCTKGKYYYVKVAAYKTVDGKKYLGSCSSTKTVYIKK